MVNPNAKLSSYDEDKAKALFEQVFSGPAFESVLGGFVDEDRVQEIANHLSIADDMLAAINELPGVLELIEAYMMGAGREFAGVDIAELIVWTDKELTNIETSTGLTPE